MSDWLTWVWMVLLAVLAGRTWWLARKLEKLHRAGGYLHGAQALIEAADWSEQLNEPTGRFGRLTADDLRARAAELRAMAEAEAPFVTGVDTEGE